MKKKFEHLYDDRAANADDIKSIFDVKEKEPGINTLEAVAEITLATLGAIDFLLRSLCSGLVDKEKWNKKDDSDIFQ